ncbi:MAG: thioredoxin domain-containing protein [Novosphingobium sp.]|uniref:DsbA family protein n=1 Tax=Novosphingobium sp. TaxID=1874826 RepID=UPI0032BB048D
MTRRTMVFLAGFVAVAIFILGSIFYTKPAPDFAQGIGPGGDSVLVRPHSPILGPETANVTVTEFFDPMCETCREFFPLVEEIIGDHQGKVRVVLRYATFHPGSEDAVRILEAARRQNKFESVLFVLLEKQSEWAAHGEPNIARAWELAGEAGLDLPKAKTDALSPEVDRVIQQDLADAKSAGVSKTPTFFVNGKPLLSFGKQQLYDMVLAEVGQ